MSLKRIALLGARWTSVSTGLETVVQFFQTLILTRLLSPNDFGLVAIVVMVLVFAKTYADMGISSAIIHRQNTTSDQLSSLFFLNIFAGIGVFLVTLVSSPIVAAAYHQPELGRLISYAAVTFLISPIGGQFGLLLQKELEFRTLAICEIVATVLGTSITIVAALEGLGAVSLVLGRLGSACVLTALFCAIGLRKWPVRLHFRRADLGGYLSFGLYQMGESTIVFFTGRIDQLFIGIALGPQALGYYVLAWNLVLQPVMKFNYILTRIAFPLFAKVQLEPERLQRGYLTLLWLLTTINAPIMIGFAATAPLLVPLFFGANWLPAVNIVQILAFYSLILSIMNPIGSVLLAKGRTDLALKWSAGLLLPEAVGIYVGGRIGGLQGVALAALFLHVLYWVAQYFLVVRALIGPCFRQYMANVFPSVGIAGIMGIIVWLWPNMPTESPLITLASKVTIGATLYVVLSIMLQRDRIYEIKGLLLAR